MKKCLLPLACAVLLAACNSTPASSTSGSDASSSSSGSGSPVPAQKINAAECLNALDGSAAKTVSADAFGISAIGASAIDVNVRMDQKMYVGEEVGGDMSTDIAVKAQLSDLDSSLAVKNIFGGNPDNMAASLEVAGKLGYSVGITMNDNTSSTVIGQSLSALEATSFSFGSYLKDKNEYVDLADEGLNRIVSALSDLVGGLIPSEMAGAEVSDALPLLELLGQRSKVNDIFTTFGGDLPSLPDGFDKVTSLFEIVIPDQEFFAPYESIYSIILDTTLDEDGVYNVSLSIDNAKALALVNAVAAYVLAESAKETSDIAALSEIAAEVNTVKTAVISILEKININDISFSASFTAEKLLRIRSNVDVEVKKEFVAMTSFAEGESYNTLTEVSVLPSSIRSTSTVIFYTGADVKVASPDLTKEWTDVTDMFKADDSVAE